MQRHWRSLTWVSMLLLPLSGIYWLAVLVRKGFYRLGLLSTYESTIPVVVIGNLTVGGTGKTPLVIALAKDLGERGWRVGVVSRGYKGRISTPTLISSESDPSETGDEALLIAQQADVPVVVCPDRAKAVQRLEAESVNMILSDDGLQHWAMGRTVEVSVVDGQYGYGNSLLLPAGPLREPRSRLKSVDIQVRRGGESAAHEFSSDSKVRGVRNLKSNELRELSSFESRAVIAVAGIHRPERFFKMLRENNIEIRELAFPDHHQYSVDDIPASGMVLMTAKDAVKCRSFAKADWWAVEQETRVPPGLLDKIETLIAERHP